MIADVNKASMS